MANAGCAGTLGSSDDTPASQQDPGRQRSSVIATRACSFHDFDHSREDQRFMLGLIGGMAALMLAMASAVHLHESHGGVFADGALSIVDRTTVFRPQGPPPVFDMDEATPEEVEPPARPSRSTGSTRATYSEAALRARPPQR